MNKYDRSTYRRDKAAQNISLIDTLDPYYSRIDRSSTAPVDILMAFVIGVVMGLILMPVIRSCDRVPEPVVVAAQTECIVCHKAPALNTLAKYKKFHRSDAAAQKRLLAELERP